VQIDDADLRAQLRGAAAQVSAAQERLERARLIPICKPSYSQANLTTQQATQESQGRVSETEMLWHRAIVEAQANLKLARTEQQRTRDWPRALSQLSSGMGMTLR